MSVQQHFVNSLCVIDKSHSFRCSSIIDVPGTPLYSLRFPITYIKFFHCDSLSEDRKAKKVKKKARKTFKTGMNMNKYENASGSYVSFFFRYIS